jgi:hypothetical protein
MIGGGSVLQQLVAHGGNTQPPLFKAAITSSPFLPSQYAYNHEKPEVIFIPEIEVSVILNIPSSRCTARSWLERSKSSFDEISI